MPPEKQEPKLLKKKSKVEASKKSRNLPKNAKSMPDKLSLVQKIINFFKNLVGRFTSRSRKLHRDYIMPPWILPPLRHRRNRKVISTLIPNRQTPKLRKKDIRKVIMGKSQLIIEIITDEGREIRQMIF